MSETPYTKEEFLKEVNSDNFYTRLQAIGRSKYCYELASEMGAEYRDIIRNIAINDASRQVRSEAIKVCQNRKIKDKNGNSIVIPDEELQLPDNITEIMENVFKKGKVGPKTQKISPSIYVKIQRAFVKNCPDTYALIRDIYPKGAQFKRFLNDRLLIYRKKCRCEEYAKKKSGLPKKDVPYVLDQDLEVVNKKYKYKERECGRFFGPKSNHVRYWRG